MTGGALPYLRLGDVALPPPLDALVAVAMAAGCAGLGSWLARKLVTRPEPVHLAAGFVAAAGTLGVITTAVASIPGLPLRATLAALGGTVALAGAAWLALAGRRALSSVARAAARDWREGGTMDRAGLALAAVSAVGLALAALGPPTDADSLDYHLGAPLEWLRNGRFVVRADWFSSRLVGAGESLNLLGLAAGTDALGGVLSAAGLLAAGIAVSAAARRPADRALGWLLVTACPAMAFLVPAQKPQLLPSAALALAVALALRGWNEMEAGPQVLAAACIGVALGCKYSMALPGLAATLILVGASRRSGRALAALVGVAGATLVFAGPTLLRAAWAYGDPFSPLLERFKGEPDPALVAFAERLRAGEFGRNLPLFALHTVVPLRAGDYSTSLGLGTLGAVLAVRARGGGARLVLACVVAVVTVMVAVGPLSPRFLLEPYLWAAAVVVSLPDGRPRRLLGNVMLAQGAVAAVAALVLAASLAPGAIATRWREAIMRRSAPGFAEWEWLDRTLPSDATVLLADKTRALSARPVIAADRVRFEAAPVRALAALVRERRPTAVVADEPFSPPFAALERACGRGAWISPPLPRAVRNPWNRDAVVRRRAVALDLTGAACRDWLARAGGGGD